MPLYPVTININALMSVTAEKKKAALQILADKMDEDNLTFLAKLATENTYINATIRNNAKTLEQAIKTL